MIERASVENDVTSYALYYGSGPTTKLDPTPIVTLAVTGTNQHVFAREGYPTGATHLLAFSVNAFGEMSTGVSVALGEMRNTSGPIDISAGQGNSSGIRPSPVVDTLNDKLLIATQDNANGGRLALYRCNTNGSGCTHRTVEAAGAASGGTPSVVIDSTAQKVLIAFTNADNSNRPGLFRCDLDGTGCAYSDISAGQAAGSGLYPSVVIDAVNGKVMVIATSNAGVNSSAPVLFRCELDGSGCSFSQIYGVTNSGFLPSAVVDDVAGKLLAVTEDRSNGRKVSLFRCDLDGSGCVRTDVSAGEGPNSGKMPSVQIDRENGKLLVATMNGARADRPGMARCNLDGTSCSYVDISAGLGGGTGESPSATITSARRSLLVVTTNTANSNLPALLRCGLDGAACRYSPEMANAAGSPALARSRAVVDERSGTVLVVGEKQANEKLVLFTDCAR